MSQATLFSPGRMAAYGAASTLAAAAVVVGALRSRSNFYSAAVMLGRSNGGMLVLLNFGAFLTLTFGKVMQQLFFGALRPVESEHLQERMWYAVTESLLAMTIFRSEFDASFAILFGMLLFLKAFHWLTADRVDFMEQTPSVSKLFHVRMVGAQAILLIVDLLLVTFTVEVLLFEVQRMGMMIMFASEFSILLATMLSITAKYVINCVDMRSEEPWEQKSMYVFFVDMVTDFLKLVIYLAFFAMILTFYGLPLNIVRDVYLTGRSLFGKIRDLLRYRAATKNMDDRYPSATAADMEAMSDGTCIICREEMVVAGDQDAPSSTFSNGLNHTPKKLPCGHIFHFHCLRAWLERQQSCPTCRRSVFQEQPQPRTEATPQPAAARPEAAAQTPPVPTAEPTPADAAPLAGPSGSSLQDFARTHGAPTPTRSIDTRAQSRVTPAINASARVHVPLQDPDTLRVAMPRARRIPTMEGGELRWTEPSAEAQATVGGHVDGDAPVSPTASDRDDGSRDEMIDEGASTAEERVDARTAARLAALKRFGQAQGSSNRVAEKQKEVPRVTLQPIESSRDTRPLDSLLQRYSDDGDDGPISMEELQRMSKMTKEGIRQRLQVLHRIDRQVWSAVQELTQVLSTLPEDGREATNVY